MSAHPVLGTIVVEPDAARLLRDAGVQLWDCLVRHLDGDLGDTAVAGAVERAALWSESGVRSRYALRDGWLNIHTDCAAAITMITTPPPFRE